VNAVVANVADVHQIVVREAILHSGHPLLHVRRVPDGVGDGVETEADVRQPPQGIARGHHFPVWKCAGQSQGGISAESRGGIQTTIERGDPRSALREADVGSRAIVVGDEEDAIAAAQHKFVAQLISSADAGRKIGVGGIVDASVAAGVEDQFARNVKSNRGG